MISFGSIFFTCISALGIWHLSTTSSLAQSDTIKPDFSGSILAASDADMIATAYANGTINKVQGIEDSLALISFSKNNPSIQSKIHASNSVISWPSVVAWNKEKQYAYVAETRGVYQEKNQQLQDVYKDMPVGTKISIFDYSDRHNPSLLQEKVIGENIQGVSLNRDCSLLVASSTEKGKEIILTSLKEGLIDETSYFSNDEIIKKASNNSGIRNVEFHPTENIFAANLNNTHLVFYKVLNQEDGLRVEQVGNSVKVGKLWSVGNWHPSGRYFITTDVAWGSGSLGAIFNRKGKLTSTKFDPKRSHEIVSEAKVGLSPEGFDVSPDGNYAIVANMRRTYGPKSFWFVPARKNSSLSLVKINPETGALQTLGKQYGFEGALPEDAIFDKESNSIAVAVYHKQDEAFPTQGWLDFWELEEDRLIKTSQRIHLTRGVHNLLLIENNE